MSREVQKILAINTSKEDYIKTPHDDIISFILKEQRSKVYCVEDMLNDRWADSAIQEQPRLTTNKSTDDPVFSPEV